MSWIQRPQGMAARGGFHQKIGRALPWTLLVAAAAGYLSYQSPTHMADEPAWRAPAALAATLAYPALIAAGVSFGTYWLTVETQDQAEFRMLRLRANHAIVTATTTWALPDFPRFEVVNPSNGEVLARLPTGMYGAESVRDFVASHLVNLDSEKKYITYLTRLDLLNDMVRLAHSMGNVIMGGPSSDEMRGAIVELSGKIETEHERLREAWNE